MDTRRNAKEAISREQALRAMTINVVRQWRQEHRMGSIEFGKDHLENKYIMVFDEFNVHAEKEVRSGDMILRQYW